MFGYLLLIIVVLIVVAWLYNLIVDYVHKSIAERRMRMYPHAVKGVFGYLYNVSLNKQSDINTFVAPAHNEDFWKKTEKEEVDRLNRCNKLKEEKPHGYGSWCILHEKQKDDLKFLDKSVSDIIELEKNYHIFTQFEEWKKNQSNLSERATSQCGYSLLFDVKTINRFGGDFIDQFVVAHLFAKQEPCKSQNVMVPSNPINEVEAIINCAKKIDSNLVFLVSPEYTHLITTFTSRNINAISITDVLNHIWRNNQTFALVISSADKQIVKYISEVLFANLQNKPLILVFSIIMTLSDTDYNIQNYKQHSPNHNYENSYVLDRLIESHQYESAYYFTVNNQTCKSVKKAISECFSKFDSNSMAEHVSRKYKYDHRSQYYRKSPEEIKVMWAEKRDMSAKLNRKLRDDIDKILSGNSYEKDNTTSLFEIFNKEWKISPYRTNWPIFDRETGIVATVDCLAYMDGKFILYSWIRTDSALDNDCLHYRKFERYLIDDVRKNSYIKKYYDKGLKGSAFESLDDCKFTKYSIEQEVIKYILKKNYGICVDNNYIVILHPTYNTPFAFNGDDVSKEVEQFMISEFRTNSKKPEISSTFNTTSSAKVTETDLESIDLMELF